MGESENILKLGKKTARAIGRAISDFGMIEKNDRVLVGLSGGKDSCLLLHAMCRLRRRSPVAFELAAVSVDPTEECADWSPVEKFARELGVPHEIIRYPVFGIIKNSKSSSPCSLCANIRRGILASAANRLGCNVLALGHHRDDAVETVFLNMIYAGRFGCFSPSMYMSRSGVRVIRPLVYVAEAAIEREATRLLLPRLDFGCAYSASSRRAEVKRKLKELSEIAVDLDSNVIHALRKSRDVEAWGFNATEHIQEDGSHDFY